MHCKRIPSFVTILVSLALVSKCQGDLIQEYCSKSINPYECNLFLRANPRSQGADARGLAQIATQNAVLDTQSCIKVAKAEANPRNQAIINACIENFGDAIDLLKDCKKLIKKVDKSSTAKLRTSASAALTDIVTCDDEFGKQKEPQRLKEASDRAYVFVQLLLIIANTL